MGAMLLSAWPALTGQGSPASACRAMHQGQYSVGHLGEIIRPEESRIASLARLFLRASARGAPFHEAQVDGELIPLLHVLQGRWREV
jgi:hypothetical protein